MKKFKRIIRISLWITGSLAVFTALGFVGSQQHNKPCRSVQVDIDEGPGIYFVDEADVMDMISSHGKKIKGSRMEDINMTLLEKTVNTNPFIENAEVFSSIDGNVTIAVHQRNPVLRIMNRKGEDFYIDEKGVFMPVSVKFTAPVLVANGFIFNTYAERRIASLESNFADTVSARLMLEQLFALANVLRKDTFWNAQVEQLYINEWQEIEMIPRIGNHRIILGDVSSLNDKLNRLLLFYKKGLNTIGWNTYRTINLKFKNQVVCSKY